MSWQPWRSCSRRARATKSPGVLVNRQQDEFERIAMPHARSLLRVARRICGDPELAEDLVQETLLLAWRGFRQFEIGTNARAWLFRVLMNAFHTRGRKLLSAPLTVPLAAPEPWVEAHAVTAAEVAQALGTLALEHRAVLLLAVVEGFTCQEIADILALPIGTVMSRLSRAREALRARFVPRERTKYAAKAGS